MIGGPLRAQALEALIVATLLGTGFPALSGCRLEPYVELQVADPRLPFLKPGSDFDALRVSVRADGCPSAATDYPPATLPATLVLVAGSCIHGAFEVQAEARLDARAVARSGWVPVMYPSTGVQVATATLADLPARPVRFRTGFESSDPVPSSGGPTASSTAALVPYPIRASRSVTGLVAETDPYTVFSGARSLLLSGSAPAGGAYAQALAAALDLTVASGDTLEFAMQISLPEAGAPIGVDLLVGSATAAKALGLADEMHARIDPAFVKASRGGLWRRYTVDLSPAAGQRVSGLVFGFDARESGIAGDFSGHLDEVSILGP